jgi:hypothetical protein
VKVKIIAHWKHGFIMEDDLEMLDGSSSTFNPEKLCNYYNSVNNIKNWWITDEEGNTLYSKEKPFKRKVQEAKLKRAKKEKDYSSLSREELIIEAKVLMKTHKNATKVATIINKSPTFVRTHTK